ncbi:MAG: S1 RNA-binding domain-containing protein, partial [Chlamydiae bacterium]|nr:S1 RNA-binding domain-containing protein [Chlamydiota bacterium]
SVVALKKLRLLHRLFEEDPNKIYTATLSKIKPFGLFFELSDLMLEGFIHISEIGDDYYLYQEKSCALEGQDTHERFQIGDRLQVSLVNLDLISQETLWQIHRTTNKKKKKKNR